jgi:hypothetical protein
MKMSMGAPSSGPKMSAHRSVVDVGEEAKDKKLFKLVAAGLANNGAKRPERGGSQVRLHRCCQSNGGSAPHIATHSLVADHLRGKGARLR